MVAKTLAEALSSGFDPASDAAGGSWTVAECQLEVGTCCRNLTLTCDAACDGTECQPLLCSE